MAINYPGFVVPKGYDNPDVFGRFASGYQFGKGISDEAGAAKALDAYADTLYGIPMPGNTPPAALAPQQTRGNALVNGSVDAAIAAQDPMLTAYFANTRRAESGGNDAARNPKSSATGRYQFLEGTWRDLAQRHPELGLTPDGRADPQQQERAIKVFTQENAKTLQGAGIPVNPGTLYAAHFLGPGGATKVLSGDPAAPVSAYVDPGVIKANPQLARMTVADFVQWSNSKGGNGQGGYQGPTVAQRQPQAVATPPAAALPPPEVMKALLRNPQTRALGVQLAQTYQAELAAGRDPARSLELQKLALEVENLRNPQAKPTTALQEYEFARSQGFQGTFQDYQMAMKKAGATNVNVGDGAPGLGKLSSDFGYVLDPDTREPVIDPETGLPRAAPIPGSPAALEAEELEKKARGRTEEIQRAGGTVVQDLNRGLELLPEMNQDAGVVGANMRNALAKVDGTAEANIKKFIESALSNVGLDRLQQMRDNSPTGGALGQVPIQQQKRLEQVLGSLDLGQKPADIKANMQRVINIYNDVMFGSKEERARAVADGNMTPEDNAYYDSLYYDLPFDASGRSKQTPAADDASPPAGWSGNPDLWQYLTPEERALWN